MRHRSPKYFGRRTLSRRRHVSFSNTTRKACEPGDTAARVEKRATIPVIPTAQPPKGRLTEHQGGDGYYGVSRLDGRGQVDLVVPEICRGLKDSSSVCMIEVGEEPIGMVAVVASW